MIKSCQTAYALRDKHITRHIVIHDKKRILADYNQASYEMAKNDFKQLFVAASNGDPVICKSIILESMPR